MKVVVEQVNADNQLIAQCLRERFNPAEIEIFNQSLRDSEQIWMGLVNNELICLWGLRPGSLLSDSAYMWSWTTPAVKKCRKIFVKVAKEVIARALTDYPTLVGLCHTKSHWLRSLGAEFGPAVSESVYTFTIRA